MQTDRNLLFGVLAFQDEYIDLAQLSAICRAWAEDKSRSIPQLLVERQWLSEPERDELERKVERKLKRYVGDVHATLGAVADGAVRDVLKQVTDPDIQASLSDWPDGGHVLMQTLVSDPLSPDKAESRYTLTHVQGEGSFGRVWMAYDKQLDREVALKELQPSKSRHPDLWRRFLREAQVTGKLQHPNIVPVYDLDRRAADQQPFYTMKLVQGRTLREAIAAYHQQRRASQADPLAFNHLLQSFVRVCEALAYAHSRGVVHRDLKPHNIVLGDFGEVIVLDWGEAKLVGTPEPPTDPNSATVQETEAPPVSSSHSVRVTGDAAEAAQTEFGKMKGSLGYMSPEQVTGNVDQMEPRTDVYGLGAILFDILTDQPPHATQEKGLTLDDWCARILANPTPRAREFAPFIPEELDEICAKAMSKERNERYQTATELKGALLEFQVHKESIDLASSAVDHLDRAQRIGHYQIYNRALFGFEEALRLWPANTRATTGITATRDSYAQTAFEHGDYDLALSVLDPDDHAHAVARLKLFKARKVRAGRLRRERWLKVTIALLITLILLSAFAVQSYLDLQRALHTILLAEDASRQVDEAIAKVQWDLRKAESAKWKAEKVTQRTEEALVVAIQETRQESAKANYLNSLLVAHNFFHQGRYSEARKKLQEIKKNDPDHSGAEWNLLWDLVTKTLSEPVPL